MRDKDALEVIKEKQKEWETECLKRTLIKYPERQGQFLTESGFVLKPVYSPVDLAEFDYLKDASFPGEYPYLRGLYPTGYRTQLWAIQQFAGYGLPEDANKRFKYLASQGGQVSYFGRPAINIAFDMPTQSGGYDSDHPLAESEVGRGGVAVDTIEDLQIMFDGFPLDRTFVSFVLDPSAPALLAMYIAYAERQGLHPDKLMGVMQNDHLFVHHVLSHFANFPPEACMRINDDVLEYCTKYMPLWNPIGICGYQIREAGGNAVHEVAFTLADGLAYVESGIRRGLKVDDFAPRLSFFLSTRTDLFEEVAKLRAFRRLWARMLKEKYKAENPRSLMARYHIQTAGSTLTAQEPFNNVVRTTIQTLAAILGGCQGLHVNAMDEALALPSEQSVKLALRTQQIVLHESGVPNVVDPLGGSYYIESLTNEMEKAALKCIHDIEAKGKGSILDGVINGIETGYFRSEIENQSYKYQQEIESGMRKIVGVNWEQSDEKVNIPLHRSDPEVERRKIESLREFKTRRDWQRSKKALEALRQRTEQGQNIMFPMIEAARCNATLGEIMEELWNVFGKYKAMV